MKTSLNGNALNENEMVTVEVEVWPLTRKSIIPCR
jgi:hypothetical protein